MKLSSRVALVLAVSLLIFLALFTIQTWNYFSYAIRRVETSDAGTMEYIAERFGELRRQLENTAQIIGRSSEGSQAVANREPEKLFIWSQLFHTPTVNRILVTDLEGTVLARSWEQFRFSDSVADQPFFQAAAEGRALWNAAELDGAKTLVVAAPVLLYGEIIKGYVFAGAECTPALAAWVSGLSGTELFFSANSADRSRYRVIRPIPTKFEPELGSFPCFEIGFPFNPESDALIQSQISLLVFFGFLALTAPLFVFLLLSRYIRPYSLLVEALGSLVNQDGDFDKLRLTLHGLEKSGNSEAGAIAASLKQWTFIIEHDIAHLEESAHRDELTGLYNRRYAQKIIEWEHRRHSNSGSPLSLLLADIDHFKMVNDTFGHDAGDAVLRAVARIFTALCRGTDIPIRWGGEEFMVICPFTSLEGCYVLAEKLRMRAESEIQTLVTDMARANRLSLDPDIFPIGTLSLGCADASIRDEGFPGFKTADSALYKAKEEGRNRTVVAP